MKKYLLLSIITLFTLFADAQVKMTQSIKQTGKDELTMTFSAKIESGWHLYAPGETNCPAPASFNLDKIEGAKLVGKLKSNKPATKKFEEMFGTDVSFFENAVTFTQKAKITGKRYKIEGYFEYSACCDSHCSPPTDKNFKFEGKGLEDTPVAETAATPESSTAETSATETPSTSAIDSASTLSGDTASTDTAVAVSPVPTTNQDNPGEGGLWHIFLLGILGGFIALVTPCVWPIIPMTVSFFLKRGAAAEPRKEGDAGAPKPKKKVLKRSAKGIRDAVIYGISIIVIYLVLGLAVTLIFGASALNALSTSAIFNIFFFLMLVVFGASFLGGFEIVLPSSWTNAVDSKASATTGLLSIFLMAFTLVLVSFSCTGPIIGFLLVEVGTSGNIIAPAIGMFGFALALALPFTLFAIFPSWLKSAPKSGNWMNNVKVTLGFIELAFSLKFLSVADLAYGWHILDREVFLSLWIVLFALLGCYLIGWIRFPHDEESDNKTGVVRFFLALCSFAFALYMVPGLWGAPCKAVSAFAPPMDTQDWSLSSVVSQGEGGQAAQANKKYTDYDEGMAAAKAAHKPVMLDFTGFGCVNCRKMEAAVFTDSKVSSIMKNDYIVIELFVDDKTKLSQPEEVQENGETIKLRTIGDKWSYLQRSKYGSNTQPFYVLVDNAGTQLTTPYSYDEDKEKFIKFLEEGKAKYK